MCALMNRGILLTVTIALALFAGCKARTPERVAPNILFISVDTLRQDHLGCYGYPRSTSPRIDEIARRGTVFETGVSTSSWTLPAHTSMLTGLYPAFHGLQDDGSTLSSEIMTLGEALRESGYHTMGVVSHVYVSSEFGLDRGFDRFDDSLIRGGARNPIAGEVVDAALELFGSVPRKPYFAFLHFFDPHWDYAAPEPFRDAFADPGYRGAIDGTLRAMMPYLRGDRTMPPADLAQAIALYDGEIAYLDAQIGRLLDRLREMGLMEGTVVVLTADHGEEFREHGRLGHGKTLFGEVLAVPIILSGHSAFPAGRRRVHLASIVDLAPTLLELAGVEPIEGLQGHSLVAPEDHDERVVFAESIRFGNEMRAVRHQRFKLIHSLQGDRRLFFDLEADPHERHLLTADPSGGDIGARLDDFAAEADRGWHLKMIALSGGELSCRGTIRVDGRIVNPRRTYSGHLEGPNKAEFRTFELSPAGDALTFDVRLTFLIGEITFETAPPDAAVSFDIDARSAAATAGVFLGRGIATPPGGPLRLAQNDPRVRGLPPDYIGAVPGCYVRAVPARLTPGDEPSLSQEALRRLRALGYVQ